MRRAIFLVVLLLVLAFFGYAYWFYYNPYSAGTRVGLLQKFARKGNVFKTYEGELLQDGFGGRNGTISAQYFYFSVDDDAIAARLEKMQGQYLKVHYTQYRRALPWRGDNTTGRNPEAGQYIVDGVELAAGGQMPTPAGPMR